MLDDPLNVPGWKASRFNGQSHGKRWGVHCNLRDRRVDSPEHPLPSILMETIVHHDRWHRLSCWWENKKNNRVIIPTTLCSSSSSLTSPTVLCPNEANAIDYRKSRGDWLQAHVDDRKLSKEPIANLSLAGPCFMTYRRTGTAKTTPSSTAAAAAAAVSTRDVSYKVWLPPRCLQILTGPARYNYTHEIAPLDLPAERRVSLTLRESPLTRSTPSDDTTTTYMGRRKIRHAQLKIDTVFRKQVKK
jgi:alkylated DNA repair dioxygenase AlkB